MKKIVSLIVAVVMMLTLATAFATEIDWATMQEQAAELVAGGEMVALGNSGVNMWVPTVMPAAELTEEDIAAGYIGYFTTEDGAYILAATLTDMGITTVEDYAAYVAEYGATEVEQVIVNGVNTVSYVIADTDTAVNAWIFENGSVLEISGTPKSDEGFQPIIACAMASIQLA